MSQAAALEPRVSPRGSFASFVESINGRHHRLALRVFMLIVFAHLAEHIIQAIQIYALGWEIPESRGVLGLMFPWLVTTEALHYGYAIVMLIGLVLLRPGFVGTARRWWDAALYIQVWHHVEHFVLLVQVWTGPWFGQDVNTSFVQLIAPRVELHLVYNTLVLIPMIVAMVNHLRPSPEDREQMACSCATHAHVPAAAGSHAH